MRNLEQELKLQLNQREYEILSALTTQQPQLQTNYYFTSEHFPPDTMVRLREKNGQWTLCFKGLLQQSNGIVVCDERECEVEKNFAQSLLSRGITPGEISSILKVELFEVLACAGKLETYRTAFDWEEWRFELDKNIYLGVCDFELECECAHVQQLEKLKNYLSFNYGIVIRYSIPKCQRFFQAKNK